MQKQGKQWSKEEDQLLAQFYRQADCFQKWKYVSSLFKEKGILKTQLQCRDRFVNYINPKLKPGKLTQTEIVKLFECYNEYGPQWSMFQNKIKGRPQNKLKNQFYSALRSLLRMFVKVGQKRNLCPYEIKFSRIKVKNLLDLYQGRKNYIKIKNFFKDFLKNIAYSIKRHRLQNQFNLQSPEMLRTVFRTIYEQAEGGSYKTAGTTYNPSNAEGMDEIENRNNQMFCMPNRPLVPENEQENNPVPVAEQPNLGYRNVITVVGLGLPIQIIPQPFIYNYYYV